MPASMAAMASTWMAARPPLSGRQRSTWVVATSSAVAEGTTYRFNGDGRLEIAGPDGGPAMVGTWRALDGTRIEMTEEGIDYTVDILEQGDARLRLRSHNPGEPVDITLVPAAAPAQ